MDFTNPDISVAIADDNLFYRAGLQSTIESFNGFKVVAVSDSTSTLMDILSTKDTPVDICILDMSMYGSYETMKAIKQKWPTTKVLVLSLQTFELNVIRTIKVGANGFILKHSNKDEIHAALLEIYKNGMFFTDFPSPSLVDQSSRQQLLLNLSYKELEFIELCCSEYSFKDIAERMKVKLSTVNSYRDALYKKLNVKNRIGIVLFALRIGMMPIRNILA